MFETLQQVGDAFGLAGEFYSYDVITMGNINSTFKVTYILENKALKSYLFQKVNTNVFKNPVEIMENIDRVTSHIRAKFPSQLSLHFYHTGDGKNYYVSEKDYFWRVSNFVDSVAYNVTEDLVVIASTGEAFGRFQMQLADFDGSTLHETIKDFHNTKLRLDKLFEDAGIDPVNRAESVAEELAYIASVRDTASKLSIMFENGDLPVRVTHNDTKANNVLFDKITKRPLLVIDLDTVMPGMPMYDFGDAVRFIASTAEEDEPDLNKVYFDTGKFRAFAKGFLGQVKDSLTKKELDNMVLGAFSITVELAARFLDDYITGDKYFKINYPQHNLVRARCQLKLAKDIMRKADELKWIVRTTLSE